MADILSQSQIDELLRSMQQEEGKQAQDMEVKAEPEEQKYSKYDFYSPKKFTKDKLKVLTSIFENYARIITSQVNGIFRVMSDITVMEVQERRYYEFVNSLNENDSVTLADAFEDENAKNLVPLMLYVSPSLAITLIDHMLGGGSEALQVKPGYRYSDVETALYRRIMMYFISALKDGFANYLKISFKLQRVEDNPSMIQDIGLDETVITILMNVDLAGVASEKIQICIPGTLMEYIFHQIDNRKHVARGYAYEDNRETIMDNLRRSSLTVTGQLGMIRLDLKDIYRLKVGDVIDMNKPRDQDVTLYVEKKPWFSGRLGVYKKNMAVRIQARQEDAQDALKEQEEAEYAEQAR